MPSSFFPSAGPRTRERLEADPVIKLANHFNWGATDLGPIASWPETLRSAARLVLTSLAPMALLIGSRGLMLYNSAYAPILGRRHPDAMGISVFEVWPEVADFNVDILQRVLTGGASLSFEDYPLTLFRSGAAEQVYLDITYSPVSDEAGGPVAVLAMVRDVTLQIEQAQALTRSRERLDLALSASGLVGTCDWDLQSNLFKSDEHCARLFGVSPERAAAGMPLSEHLQAIHSDDRERVQADIVAALGNPGRFRIEFRIDGAEGPIWVVATGRVIADEAGKPLRLTGVVVDSTRERLIADQLVESERRFRTIADTMPQMVWSTLPDGTLDYTNARWQAVTGEDSTLSDRGWEGLLHPDDQVKARQAWEHSLATGEPYRIEIRLLFATGEYRWVLAQALPVNDCAGRIVRWFGTCTDIHESRSSFEERELISQELSHRIKNIFAVIGGIVSLAARAHPEATAFAEELRARIIALGRAHDFVRPHSRSSGSPQDSRSLGAIIEELMSPYRLTDDDRIVVSGDDAAIDEAAATPLALIFHELATNAAKYGALAQPAGRVEITISTLGDICRVTWRELGGPPAPLSKERGFGSKLIDLSVEGQLKGRLERRWEADGLVAELELPLESLSRTAGLQA